MKIRTDFVTNSSSSSFVVELGIELKNKNTITFAIDSPIAGDMDNPDNPVTLSIEVENKNGGLLFECYDEESEFLDESVFNTNDDESKFFEEITECDCEGYFTSFRHRVNLGEIKSFTEIGDIVNAINKSFSVKKDKTLSVLSEFLKSTAEIKSLTLNMDFWACGDFPICPRFVIGYIFGTSADDIISILEEDTPKSELISELKECDCLSGYDTNSIKSLIAFWQESDEFICDSVNVIQTLKDNGPISLKITNDESEEDEEYDEDEDYDEDDF